IGSILKTVEEVQYLLPFLLSQSSSSSSISVYMILHNLTVDLKGSVAATGFGLPNKTKKK
ncbi:hypothetical protein HN873_041068, partial [Arachis hypogaea]